MKLAAACGQPSVVNALSSADDDPAKAPYWLGRAYQRSGDWLNAAVAYRQALSAAPHREDIRKRFDAMRAKAPHWGFFATDAAYGWALTGDTGDRGFVGRIDDQNVAGWIPASAPGGSEVEIRLNGRTIATARATRPVTLPDGHDYLEFTRQLGGLIPYLGAGDVLAVEHGGRPLEIIGHGDRHVPTSRQSRSRKLFRRLDEGYVFNKYGKLRRSIKTDRGWQQAIYQLYSRLRVDLGDEYGLALFPFYGTLLGAVREQNFIGHDNDFDTIYVSAHSEPEKVQDEFRQVCNLLLSRGYHLKVKPTHTWVKVPGTTHKLDIFFGWFDADGNLGVSYGYHGRPLQRTSEFFKLRSERLGEFEVPVPSNAEDVLLQLYGADWRTPNPGFAHHSASRKMDRRYHLPTAAVTELHWNQFYRDHKPDSASPFAQFVADQFENVGTLVEFGCGGGRDGIFFASRGWTVFGGDRSPEAITSADEVRAAGAPLAAHFDVVDVADEADIRRFLAHATTSNDGTRPLVIYTRFFLHAIAEEAQDRLLATLCREIDRAFYMCAEFRTVRDRDLAKVHGEHYRRYIDQDRLAEKLRREWKFEIQHLETGQGLSPYGDEDPHLARIIAVRPKRS